MLAKEIKNGSVVVYNGSPVIIRGITVQSPSARGAATLYKFKAHNLVSKQKVDITLKGTESLDEADFQKRGVKMMYTDATHIYFLDQTDFNQYDVELGDVEDEIPYLTEELEGVLAMIYNDECVGIQLPSTVEMVVDECDPSVKGDSATKRTKPAKMATGLVVQVPEYLSAGEKIKIDTRTGAYLSRA